MTALPDAPHTSDSQHLIECIVGSWRTQAVGAAIKLGVVDELQNEPTTADEIASALGLDAESLIRLLRALCTLGICREHAGQGFSISERGQLLTSAGVDGVSLRSLALWWSGPLWSLWLGLDYSVRTGKSYREKLTGSMPYGHLDNDATQSNQFHEAMVALTALVAPSVAQLSLWREATHMVDVGGGYGQLALTVLRAHEGLHATIVDLIHARAGAQAKIEHEGLGARCTFVAGSFFEAWPAGADVYLLKSILHNWDDEHCARILANCRRAAVSGARLLLIERIRPDCMELNPEAESVFRADLNMLVGLGGRERTFGEYGEMLAAQGFSLIGRHQTAFEFAVLEARAV